MNVWNKIHSRIDYRVKSLSPQRIVARFNGPTIVANSIPKAGTHLLSKCLMGFPQLSYSGFHYSFGTPDINLL